MAAVHLQTIVFVLTLGSLVVGYKNPRCLSSCQHKTDGKYQSCKNCHVYVTCTEGLLMDGWPCPSGTLWDDDDKNCKRSSNTCTDEEQQQTDAECQCASSCRGLTDGKYQSCNGCNIYALCRNGQLIDDQQCPRFSFWDDNDKRCLFKSSTCGSFCQDTYRPYRPRFTSGWTTTTTRPRTTIESSSEQHGQQTGGQWPKWPLVYSRRPYQGTTPSGSGSVCGCITDCSGRSGGVYPSCQGCGYFAICFNGQLYDGQGCPRGTVWHDKVKACVRGNDFCKTDCAQATTDASVEQESEEKGEEMSGQHEVSGQQSNEDESNEQNNSASGSDSEDSEDSKGSKEKPSKSGSQSSASDSDSEDSSISKEKPSKSGSQSSASDSDSGDSGDSKGSGGRPQWGGRGRGWGRGWRKGRGHGRGRGQGRSHFRGYYGHH